MLLRYLAFCKSVKGRLFNVGDYRRRHGLAGVGSSFFDPSNSEAQKAREHMASTVLEDLLLWMKEDEENRIAVLDATNTTVMRRKSIVDRVRAEDNVYVMVRYF